VQNILYNHGILNSQADLLETSRILNQIFMVSLAADGMSSCCSHREWPFGGQNLNEILTGNSFIFSF
jgi:hypothetical protein